MLLTRVIHCKTLELVLLTRVIHCNHRNCSCVVGCFGTQVTFGSLLENIFSGSKRVLQNVRQSSRVFGRVLVEECLELFKLLKEFYVKNKTKQNNIPPPPPKKKKKKKKKKKVGFRTEKHSFFFTSQKNFSTHQK